MSNQTKPNYSYLQFFGNIFLGLCIQSKVCSGPMERFLLFLYGFNQFQFPASKGLVPFTQLVKVRRGKLVLALPSI